MSTQKGIDMSNRGLDISTPIQFGSYISPTNVTIYRTIVDSNGDTELDRIDFKSIEDMTKEFWRMKDRLDELEEEIDELTSGEVDEDAILRRLGHSQ